MISMSLRGTGAAAVLCLLATAPRAAHAQTCDDGTILVGGACRPCGATGQFPCPADQNAPGCADGFTVNAEGRCRPCGDFQELVCVGLDGEAFCTGDRVIPGPERCERCGSFGTLPCDDALEPCDEPELFPAPDDGNICRPCGARFRACCPPAASSTPCRFDFQECVDGLCLRCDVPDPDPGCPNFTGVPAPPTDPLPVLDPSECPDGKTPNSRGGCSDCGDFAQLVCVGDDGSRFCTGDRVIVGPERCDRCGSFGTPPCDEGEPCDGPNLFPAPDDGNICRPCGARFRACCPPGIGLSTCRFDFQECVDGFCLRCDVADPDPGCPGEPAEEEAVGPTETPALEPEPDMVPDMMAATGPGPADGPEDAADEMMVAPADDPAMAPV